MAKIKVHAGTFGEGVADADFNSGFIRFPWNEGPNSFDYLDDIAEIDVATEGSVRRIGGTLGWGAAGALLLGPVGLLAGLLVGGRKQAEVTFVAKFENGSKLLATADKDTYTKLLARAF